mmetsp:Transcript_77456/g.90252  ORF Transcript_77456/g.90252 Transcript_77456/m.90252 type:complete len:135 (+) Transcript_77456:74-478(+)
MPDTGDLGNIKKFDTKGQKEEHKHHKGRARVTLAYSGQAYEETGSPTRGARVRDEGTPNPLETLSALQSATGSTTEVTMYGALLYGFLQQRWWSADAVCGRVGSNKLSRTSGGRLFYRTHRAPAMGIVHSGNRA